MINLRLNNEESKQLSEEEIEIAMARKLEILILPYLRRNIKFFYAGGNLKGKAKAYRKELKQTELEKMIKEKSKNAISTVCKPFCEMVVKILNENGINAQTVSCDTDMFRHTDVLLTTRTGKQVIINYLEDIENIQTGMKTPDFASYSYYERRYKKFEGGLTTDGKDISNITFLSEEQMNKIDTNLGYKKCNMYMDSVIEQIRTEFLNFKEIMAENEWLAKELEMEKLGIISANEKLKEKNKIYEKYRNLTNDEELELKLDWLFNFFNDRMNIKGHTDFVMYHSRVLLKRVLTPEEYSQITRYECFAYKGKLPQNNILKEILDTNNLEETKKLRFCMIKAGNSLYAFSTRPNKYIKLREQDLNEMRKYTHISKTEKPSDLLLYLCDRGNALPLVFNPLGTKILNERADLIDKKLSFEERKKAIRCVGKLDKNYRRTYYKHFNTIS